MGYSGQAYSIPYTNVGMEHNPNMDGIRPTSIIDPSRNLIFHEGGARKRGGTAKINSTAISGGPRIMGLFDFQRAGTSFQMIGGKDGKLYKTPTDTIKTGLSTTNHYSFAVFNDELYVCDGDTVPQTWDGAAAGTSDLTSPNSDWSGSSYPFQCITHGYGDSYRMWYLFGDSVYYSALNDGKEVSVGTSGYIPISTGDDYGLVGGVEFGDRLVVFGRNDAYIIDDTNSATVLWGYKAAQWSGGVAHWRLIAETPNDIICMAPDGDIYSVSAAEHYGDYKAASLTRPAYIDRWIRENVRLAYINDFHAVYDPVMRAVKFFVVRTGQTEVDTALVFYIDRPLNEAWVYHDNQSNSSGYDASASTLVRVGAGNYQVYTGDYSGFLWKLEQPNRNDDGNGYQAPMKTPSLNMGNPRVHKQFKRTRIITKVQGNFDLDVNWWVDGTQQTATTASLSGAGDVFGTGQFGTAVFGGAESLDTGFDMNQVGKRVQIEINNSTANEDYFISEFIIDHKVLGAKAS